MIIIMAHSHRAIPNWAEVCKELRSVLQDSLDEIDSALYGGADPVAAVESVVSDLWPILSEQHTALGGK